MIALIIKMTRNDLLFVDDMTTVRPSRPRKTTRHVFGRVTKDLYEPTPAVPEYGECIVRSDCNANGYHNDMFKYKHHSLTVKFFVHTHIELDLCGRSNQ